MKWACLMLVLAACAEPRTLSRPCDADAGTCEARVHPVDFLDPASPDFHGKELARRNWDFALCQTCHGQDYAGGAAKVSCLGCHAGGPTACSTCHGAGAPDAPTSGAHAVHLGVAKLACSECHVEPASWDAPGHIVDVDLTRPVPVVFGARANLTIDPADRAGAATWDGQACRNVYCHGDALHDAGGTAREPRWDDPAAPGQCDRCHGAPPATHLRADCATCHPEPAGTSAGASHIDGVVQLGRTPGCDGCHGSAASPAPPTDLEGNTLTTAIGVGAHQAHLQSSYLRGPVPCATCHVVPENVTDPGHLGAGPAPVTASLGWDRASQTCTTAWCHGAGRPVWTSQGQVVCGSCHGIPPGDAPHTPDMTLTTCVTCHAATVDAFGSIVVTNGASHHMDGVVDAN